MKINLKKVQVTSYSLHTDGSSARRGNTLNVIAPKGTFKRGERIPMLTLQDKTGKSVALELAHVVQTRPGGRSAGDTVPVDQVSLNFSQIKHEY